MTSTVTELGEAIRAAAKAGRTITDEHVQAYWEAGGEKFDASVTGKDTTATIDWATSITFDIPSTKKKFVGTITNQLQTESYGNVVAGTITASGRKLSQQTNPLTFEVTNYPGVIIIIIIYSGTTICGVFQGPGGITSESENQTYTGNAVIQSI